MLKISRDVPKHRHCEPELMDDPQLDPAEHEQALRGLARLNRLSRSSRLLWPPLWHLVRRLNQRHLRVLDIASGAGDVPIELWQRSTKAGIRLDLHGVDISPRAVDYAQRRAARHEAPLTFTQFDALTESLPTDFDVITCSLFLHHLRDEQAQQLLTNMRKAARHLVLVHDLRRSQAGRWLAQFAARAFTRSQVVHVDAVRSVRAAFSLEEARQLATSAGLAGASVTRHWPYRFLLRWERP